MTFSVILTILTFFTGVMWALDRWCWGKKRRAAADEAVRMFESANREAINRGEAAVIDERNAVYGRCVRQPWWLDYTAGLFPVFLFVFVLRSFIVEPFRIPSGSMLPTLHIGDFILVNKFEYGLRFPIGNFKMIPMGTPDRGDVVVFHYPLDTSVDYIKRVVGLPGDTVRYADKQLFVNGVAQAQTAATDWTDPDRMVVLTQKNEALDGHEHLIAVEDALPADLRGEPDPRGAEVCRYFDNGFECTVPKGSYFVMGDNRDNSEDSRYWGVVPDANLVGRAFLIWANFSEMSRVGSFK